MHSNYVYVQNHEERLQFETRKEDRGIQSVYKDGSATYITSVGYYES